jgi:methionyl-tRNA synthetase
VSTPGRFFVTTPIYYVNDVPHAGHAYTTIAADVLARYHRARGHDTFFLTGSDEHGINVANAAEQHGKTPKEYADQVVVHFKEAWRSLNISNDYFVRTTDQRHEAAVQQFFVKWQQTGDIYKGSYEGLYCQKCERYYQEDELVDGKCPFHFTPPVHYSEENYFFRLSKYRDALVDALLDPGHPHHYKVEPTARRNEVLGKLRQGLQDVSVSRPNLTWGVPLPFDRSHTIYVWMEALLNYVTAVGYGDDSVEFARRWPAQLHLMAKDIVWFHAIIWPAMLISNGVPVPRKVYAHGFFTLNGRKMSKSLGNTLSPAELIERYGADGTRYLLLSEFPFGTDGDISLRSFDSRFNSDLANDLGNLLNRTVSMVNRYFGGQAPPLAEGAEGADAELRAAVDAMPAAVESALDRLEFSSALETLRGVVSAGNRYVDATQPWALARENRERLAVVIANLLETLRLVALELRPFVPDSVGRMLDQLGLAADAGRPGWGGGPREVTVVERPSPLFPKIETATA